MGAGAATSNLSLQIPVRLASPIFVHHIGERDTAVWPEPSHRVAHWQQGIGMDAATIRNGAHQVY
jgi:hypothetical protein